VAPWVQRLTNMPDLIAALLYKATGGRKKRGRKENGITALRKLALSRSR
jgi:hypothetical protein